MNETLYFTPLEQTQRKLLTWTPEEFATWIACPRFAKIAVKNILFVAAKAPLSTVYETKMTEKDVFTPDSFLEALYSTKSSRPVDIGLVIDATFDEHYYHDLSEWEQWDVEYTKLSVPSATSAGIRSSMSPPPDEVVREFVTLCKEHWSGPNRDRQVAVFSRHGFNTAGYFIISYLIEQQRVPIDKAVAMFREARSPGIYRKELLESLYKKYYRSFSPGVKQLSKPSLPKWDNVTEVAHDDEEVVEIASVWQNAMLPPPMPAGDRPAGQSNKRRRLTRSATREITFPLTPIAFGRPLTPDSAIYNGLLDILKTLSQGVRGDFPGSQHTKLSSSHLQRGPTTGVLSTKYFVSWRPEGRRLLLVILKGATYAVDETMNITELPHMHFPKKQSLEETIDKTILDGILIKDNDAGVSVDRYLIEDILTVEGVPVFQQPFDKRLQYLQNSIVGPRKQKAKYDYSREPFRVRMKDQYKLNKTEWMLKSFLPKVPHKVEGLSFTPITAPYAVSALDEDEPTLFYATSPSESNVNESELLTYVSSITQT